MRELVKTITSSESLASAKCPFVLRFVNGKPLWVIAYLRHLPGKRITLLANHVGQWVVVKLFIARNRAEQHYLRELKGLDVLKHQGVATATILYAGAYTWPNTYMIMTSFLHGAKTLSDCLKTAPLVTKLALAQSFIKNIRSMHQRQVIQKDLHGGNFLYWQQQWYCVDGDAISYHRWHGCHSKQYNLALSLYQIISDVPEITLDQLLNLKDIDKNKIKKCVEKIIYKKQHEFLQKTQRECSAFGLIKDQHYHGYYKKSCVTFNDAKSLFHDKQDLLIRTTIMDGVIKQETHKKLSKEALLRQWQYHQLFSSQQVPVVSMVAMKIANNAYDSHSWYITQPSIVMKDFLKAHAQTLTVWQDVVAQAVRIYLRLQQLRLSFYRLHAHYFVVNAQGRVFLSGFEAVKLHRFNMDLRKASLKNWRDLLLDFQDLPNAVELLQQSLAKEKGKL